MGLVRDHLLAGSVFFLAMFVIAERRRVPSR